MEKKTEEEKKETITVERKYFQDILLRYRTMMDFMGTQLEDICPCCHKRYLVTDHSCTNCGFNPTGKSINFNNF